MGAGKPRVSKRARTRGAVAFCLPLEEEESDTVISQYGVYFEHNSTSLVNHVFIYNDSSKERSAPL